MPSLRVEHDCHHASPRLDHTLADGLFFSLIDPEELLHLIGQPDMPPMAAYTVGFFFCWMFTALTGLLTYYLIKVPADHNSPL